MPLANSLAYFVAQGWKSYNIFTGTLLEKIKKGKILIEQSKLMKRLT